MKKKMRILLLEDDAVDADLIAHELEASGLSFQLARIQTEAELRRELEFEAPDLILSDHGLPSFDGFTALEIVRELRPELPFIFVSGSNDQGMVAKMYEQGATDYVFKRDLEDLRPAVAEALELTPPPTETDSDSPQRELKLRLPTPPPAQTYIALPIGQLSFCPKCRQARDESGQTVDIERFFGSHSEITTFRQPCRECEPVQPKH
jgi:CheY-like chemotaxis protein